jgi:molybdopterin-guanine dinucleotide biosynthesis protein A
MGDDWSGVVLTGGKSRRMGRDKALVRIAREPMAVRVVRALEEAGAVDVVCVGGDTAALAALGLDTIEDEYPDGGPLGGLISGLSHTDGHIVLVTPCDLLAPEAAAFRLLVGTLLQSDALVAVPIVGGVWRPLPAAFRAASRPRLVDAFEAGERAVHRAIERLAFVAADVGPMADADTPEDLSGSR